MQLSGTKPEAKSFDTYPVNWQPTAGAWVTAAGSNAIWSGSAFPGGMLTATNGSATTSTNGNGLLVLNAIPVGNDIFQRVGRIVFLKTISLKASFCPPATWVAGSAPTATLISTTSQAITSCRILLVYDRQFNAALPDKSAVLAKLGDSGVAAAGGIVSSQSNYNLGNRGRFLVLSDKQYRIDGVFNRQVDVRIFKRLNLKTVFNDATSGVASIMTGALLLLAVSDQPMVDGTAIGNSVAAPCPCAPFPNCRVRFMDP